MSQDVKRVFGTQQDPGDKRDYLVNSLLKAGKIKPVTNAAQIDYTAEMSPVRDQGSLGSCVAFAVCAVKEWQERKERKETADIVKSYDFSEQWLYYKCKEIDSWPNQAGTSFRFAMKVLEKEGVPVEQGWDYNPAQVGTPEDWAKHVAKLYKCGTYWRVSNLAELKLLIAAEGPQPIGIVCFDEFYRPVDGVVPLPANRKKPEGGHGICVVGYDDTAKLVKFKNSWGKNWGVNGYGYLSYDYYAAYCLDAWYFADVKIQDNNKDKVDDTPSAPKEVKIVATKVKLFNTMRQLQQIHIVRNGKDTMVPIPGRQMATVMSDEMTADVRMRISRGLLQKK